MQDLNFDLQLFSEGDGAPSGTSVQDPAGSAAPAGESTGISGVTHSKAAAYAARAQRYAKLDGRPLVPDAAPTPAPEEQSRQDAADKTPEQADNRVTPTADPPDESFDSLIGKNGKFEKEYNSRVSAAIKGRLRNVKQAEEKLREFAPLIGRIADSFGLDGKDIYNMDVADLISRFDEDTRLIADEADAKGENPKSYARVRALERQSKDAQMLALMDQQAQQAQQAEIDRQQRMERIAAESDALRQKYPTFDLASEMQNERFKGMLSRGASIEEAYEYAHMSELISGGMQYAAKKAEAKVTATVQANRSRPSEAGMTSSATAATSFPDFASMKRSDFNKLVREVKSGRRVNF